MNKGQSDSVSSFYTIQAYSQSDRKAAEENRDMLTDKGYEAYIQTYLKPDDDQTWFRVRVGKYPDLESALRDKKRLSELLKSEDLWIDKLRSDD